MNMKGVDAKFRKNMRHSKAGSRKKVLELAAAK
eukprot:CAMPEP_0205813294 /NCGR_PEP_ID=MMETSP0205-20121125/17945_1 /ASSEMBLY_ACC=CAM_ASM_000278 /TAXON_ID=36767 /ORGANISM="Euplotes focardii, Strain TN1" /LENGTH=32 /DNA_ID= /DNA_START= /DNA_END= /DNA_ORIENTATION=